MAEAEVKAKITVDSNTKGVDEADNALGKFGKTLSKISEIALGVGLERLGETIVNFGGKFLKDSVEEANNFTKAMTTLDIISGRFGISGAEAQKAAQRLSTELRIGVGPAAEGLQNLLKSGLSLDKASDLMKRFANEAITGKAANISLSQAVQNLTFAYTTGNSALGNLSGISENFSDITEKGKESLIKKGVAVKSITDDMAKYEGMVNLTNLTLGSSERFHGTLIDKQAELGQKVQQLQVALGTALMPTITNFVSLILNSGILEGLKNMASHFGEIGTKVGELNTFYKQHQEAINIMVEIITIALVPALVRIGVEAGIAAIKIGIEFAASLTKAVAEMVIFIVQSWLLVAAFIAKTVQIGLSTIAMGVHTVATTAARVATTVWTAAQWLLNAALSANPLGIVLIALTAMTAGIIYAYTHSEKFRGFVNDLWEKIKGFASFLRDNFLSVLTSIGNAFNAIGEAASKAFSAMKNVIGAGGTPKFANGVQNFGGGMAIVGENGPELVHLPQGSDVIPNHKMKNYQSEGSSPSGSSGGGVTINQTNYVYSDLDMEQKLRDLAFALAV